MGDSATTAPGPIGLNATWGTRRSPVDHANQRARRSVRERTRRTAKYLLDGAYMRPLSRDVINSRGNVGSAYWPGDRGGLATPGDEPYPEDSREPADNALARAQAALTAALTELSLLTQDPLFDRVQRWTRKKPGSGEGAYYRGGTGWAGPGRCLHTGWRRRICS